MQRLCGEVMLLMGLKRFLFFLFFCCLQGAGAGSQTQDPRGHGAGLQAQVPPEVWPEGEQQEVPAVRRGGEWEKLG